jgi:hypothetical protein
MKELLITIFLVYMMLAFVCMILFLHTDITKHAWGYRIKKITYKNGTIKYFVQQRIPLLMLWINCSRMIGMETYENISFETEDEARKYIEDYKEHVKLQEQWNVNKRENIKP